MIYSTIRSLLSDKFYAFSTVLILTIGFAGNIALFGIYKGVILDPIPYEDPSKIVHIWRSHGSDGLTPNLETKDFRHLQANSRTLIKVGAFELMGSEATLRRADGAHSIQATQVSSGFLGLLGVNPLMGRQFLDSEESPGRNQVAILSYGAWRRYFAEDPGIVGKTLNLEEGKLDIVGVLPPDFVFPVETRVFEPDILIPLARGSSSGGLRVLARLAPDISISAAGIELDSLAQDASFRSSTSNLEGYLPRPLTLILGGKRKTLMLHLAVGYLLFLIAGSSVTSMIILRGERQKKTFAIRSALGATRLQVAGRFMLESSLLSLVGALAGLSFAYWQGELVLRKIPTSLLRLPHFGPILERGLQIDWQVIGYTVGLALLSASIFSIIPAIRTSRANLSEFISRSEGQGRIRHMLVMVQVALVTVFLSGTGLIVRSIWKELNVDLGIQLQNIGILERIQTPAGAPGPAEKRIHREELLRRVSALPGVEASAAVDRLPFSGAAPSAHLVTADGRSEAVSIRAATAKYFSVMGIDLVEGRLFDRLDDGNGRLAIVSRTLADLLWPEDSALGRQLPLDDRLGTRTIVGIVSDTRDSPSDPLLPEIYIPMEDDRSHFAVLARTATSPEPILPAMLRVGTDLDPMLSTRAISIRELHAKHFDETRFNAWLLAGVSAFGTLLSVVSVYSLSSIFIRSRRHEISVRLACGASQKQIYRMVLRFGMKPVLVGAAAGVLCSIWLGESLTGALFQTDPTEPSVLAGTVLAVLAAALTSCMLVAGSAARIEPASILNSE